MQQLRFSINNSHIRKSIQIVSEFIPHLQGSPIRYRFPFTNPKPLKKILDLQVTDDRDKYASKLFLDTIKNEWGKREMSVFSKISADFDHAEDSMLCVFTFYGPFGYYNTPDTIYINIALTNNIEFILETICHEILHLILNKQTNKMSYEEQEDFIDNYILNKLTNIFPLYRKQFFYKT